MHGKAWRIARLAPQFCPLANTCKKHLLTDHLKGGFQHKATDTTQAMQRETALMQATQAPNSKNKSCFL